MVKIMTDNKKILTDHRSSSGARFFQDILNILSLGLYSKYTKGTFAFWKSRGEVLTENLGETLKSNSPD
jgi:VPS inhibitor protein E